VAPQASIDILERAVAAKGRVLRVEADRITALPRILALTFDIGRVVLRPAGEALGVEAVADRDALPAGLVSLEEEDPWWRVLGQPITAAWPLPATDAARSCRAVKLRFREADQNPRIVGVTVAGPALRVTLEGS
jgi:hypothetical protein